MIAAHVWDIRMTDGALFSSSEFYIPMVHAFHNKQHRSNTKTDASGHHHLSMQVTSPQDSYRLAREIGVAL